MRRLVLGLLGVVFWMAPGTLAFGSYTWATYGGHQYTLTQNYGNWQECENEAVLGGGHLATINDAAENDWLTATFGGCYAQGHLGDPWYSIAWIGFEKIGGEWRWVSGEPVTLSAPWWASPDIKIGTHAYLHTSTHPNPGTWWNSEYHDTDPAGYPRGIIESGPEPATIPEPTTLIVWSLLGVLGVSVAEWGRKRAG